MVVSSLYSRFRVICCVFFFALSIPISLSALVHNDCPDSFCAGACGVNNCQDPIKTNTNLLIEMVQTSAEALKGKIFEAANGLLFQLVSTLTDQGVAKPNNLEGKFLNDLGTELDIFASELTNATTSDLNAHLTSIFGTKHQPCLSNTCCAAVETVEDQSLKIIEQNLKLFNNEIQTAVGALSTKYASECHALNQTSVVDLFAQFNTTLKSKVQSATTSSQNSIINWSDNLDKYQRTEQIKQCSVVYHKFKDCSGIPSQPCLPTLKPTPVPTFAPTLRPTKAPTHVPTKEPTHAPTKQPTHEPTKAPTHAPTKNPTHVPTKAPTHAPTKQPTFAPTHSPTEEPTNSPTNPPTEEPTNSPTGSPVIGPIPPIPAHITPGTASPTSVPIAPTYGPTEEPTYGPTEEPTYGPTEEPTYGPTEEPTNSPTEEPTYAPTEEPTNSPTEEPTNSPTEQPTNSPTEEPTNSPTEQPTNSPTEEPTNSPTEQPTNSPTEEPTNSPTEEPTNSPTEEPTNSPTEQPTNSPTEEPTNSPTEEPTNSPTEQPTNSPTEEPTNSPTEQPTNSPTEEPTNSPTEQPTNSPTEQPTNSPTEQPTNSPTEQPTNSPTGSPALGPIPPIPAHITPGTASPTSAPIPPTYYGPPSSPTHSPVAPTPTYYAPNGGPTHSPVAPTHSPVAPTPTYYAPNGGPTHSPVAPTNAPKAPTPVGGGPSPTAKTPTKSPDGWKKRDEEFKVTSSASASRPNFIVDLGKQALQWVKSLNPYGEEAAKREASDEQLKSLFKEELAKPNTANRLLNLATLKYFGAQVRSGKMPAYDFSDIAMIENMVLSLQDSIGVAIEFANRHISVGYAAWAHKNLETAMYERIAEFQKATTDEEYDKALDAMNENIKRYLSDEGLRSAHAWGGQSIMSGRGSFSKKPDMSNNPYVKSNITEKSTWNNYNALENSNKDYFGADASTFGFSPSSYNQLPAAPIFPNLGQ